MNDHSVYIGNIQSCLDDRSRNQYIDISVDKRKHNSFKFTLTHLPVCKIHSRIREKFRNSGCHICYIIDTVVHIIYLPASSKFAVNCLTDGLFIILHNIRLNRYTIHRRLFKDTHIADTDHAHMKGSRNRCCRQCQYVNVFFQLLDFFFMGHTETLFLINDQKTEVLVFYIL